MELSKRLLAAASLLPQGYPAADVGCDHGYAAIWLAETGRCPRVIAMDVREGPLSAARRNIQNAGLEDYIETRRSDGLAALRAGEVSGLLAAGMGGTLMIRILSEGMARAQEALALVVQPQSHLRDVRRFLRENGWVIDAEDMVWEDGKFYPMCRALTRRGLAAFGKRDGGDGYAAECSAMPKPGAAPGRSAMPGQGSAAALAAKSGRSVPPEPAAGRCAQPKPGAPLEPLYDTYGKLLLRAGHPVLLRFLQKERAVCGQILAQITERGGGQKQAALAQLYERMRLLEEACRVAGLPLPPDAEGS